MISCYAAFWEPQITATIRIVENLIAMNKCCSYDDKVEFLHPEVVSVNMLVSCTLFCVGIHECVGLPKGDDPARMSYVCCLPLMTQLLPSPKHFCPCSFQNILLVFSAFSGLLPMHSLLPGTLFTSPLAERTPAHPSGTTLPMSG